MNELIRHDDPSRFTKMIDLEAEAVIEPGIYLDIPNEAYHKGPGVSKSGLWTIHTKTPAHFKFPPEKKETTQSKAIKDFGTAAHLAILEPNEFETKVVKGPADRRGNKWSDLEEMCALDGRLLLVEEAYENVLRIYDLFRALRRERNEAKRLNLWTEICRLELSWHEDDKATRGGRKSYSSPADALARLRDKGALPRGDVLVK